MPFIINLFVFLGLILVFIQLFMIYIGIFEYYHIPFIALSVGLSSFGYYFRTKLAKVNEINNSSIRLVSKRKKITINENDILSIRRLVHYSISESAWIIITFCGNTRERERWLVQVKPNLGLLDKLKKIEVGLKNKP